MKPTTSHRTSPKARSSAPFPAHIADELRRYDEHLRDVRGLAVGTRKGRLYVAGMLLRQKFNGRAIDISRLRADDIRQFLASQLEAHRTASNASRLAGALRSYLRYRATCGDSVSQSFQALQAQVLDAASLAGRVRQILRIAFTRQGRSDRLILLIGLLGGPALIGALFTALEQSLPGLLTEFSRVINLTNGLLASLVIALAKILKGSRVFDTLETVMKEVEWVQQRHRASLLEKQRADLEATEHAVKAAQARLNDTQQRVRSLEQELSALSPEHQLQGFLGARTSSDDYKKQLGLVSLVRGDFEKLSELLRTSEALEARWYERRREALKAGRQCTQPKRRILPLQRVILYIDDLDRCHHRECARHHRPVTGETQQAESRTT